jgi:hypothetical protein
MWTKTVRLRGGKKNRRERLAGRQEGKKMSVE